MSGVAQPATEYSIVESEPPELMGRNLNSAAHLLSSATAFFFLAFVFAYFYLRSLNNAHLWQPKHVDPSLTLGTLVMALTVASALLVRLGVLDHRAARRQQWRLKGLLALAVGLLAVVLQFVEWFSAGFGPADGGYASVFIGWTAFNVLFVLGTLFWLENLVATAFRYRRIPSGAPAPVRRPATRGGSGTTSPIRCRSCGRGSSLCPSTGRSSRGSASSPGSCSTSSEHATATPWRRIALALGLVSLLAAFAMPLTHKLFTAHMAQHVLLLAVAPPLLMLTGARTRLWRSLPRALTHPLCAWTLFNVTMIVWHVPALYDLGAA